MFGQHGHPMVAHQMNGTSFMRLPPSIFSGYGARNNNSYANHNTIGLLGQSLLSPTNTLDAHRFMLGAAAFAQV
jgi:hypothetical protein